jgi:thiol-disulfide isomerase/thioredoxin
MKLDPKYFNLFIAVCAVFTLIVIVFGTMRYHSSQEKTVRENINGIEIGDVTFTHVSESDSLTLSEFHGDPVLITFWASWSGKSQQMHEVINDLQQNYPDFKIIAAAVRDDQQMIMEYINMHDYSFIYVIGTDFYHQLQVPGVPFQVLIDGNGDFFDIQIGGNRDDLIKKVDLLMTSNR